MSRHIWFPYLAGTACAACGVFKRPETVNTPCEGAQPGRPLPGATPPPPAPDPS